MILCLKHNLFLSLLFQFREEDLIDFYWLQLNYMLIGFLGHQIIQKQSQYCSLNSVTNAENSLILYILQTFYIIFYK